MTLEDKEGYRKPQGAWIKDLEWANNQDARIERLWSRVFGQGAEYHKTPDGSAKQRSGCDRTVTLLAGNRDVHGETVTLEEKVRRVPYTKYNDVLFEIEHVYDDGHTEPGWAGKWPSAEQFAWIWLGTEADRCDYILAIPTQLLRAHFETIVRPHLPTIPTKYFRTCGTNNDGYVTRNLHLPVSKAVPSGLFRPSRVNWPKGKE